MYKSEFTKEVIEKLEVAAKEMGVSYQFLFNYLNDRNPHTKRKDRKFEDIFCKCGNYKGVLTRKNGQQYMYVACKNPECRKRPKHAKRMKELAAKENTPLTGLIKKGQLLNKEVNTVAFKEKVLNNKGIEFEEGKVEEAFSQMLSERILARPSLNKRLWGMISKFSLPYKEKFEKEYGKQIDLSYIEKLDEEDFSKFKFFVWGLNTLSIPANQGRNSFYKRPLVKGLKYNKRGITSLMLRSGYEEKYVLFFEKQKVFWDYEVLVFGSKEGGSYSPDFIFEKGGKTWVLEVKGCLFRQGPSYIENKIIPARDECEKKGWGYCFTFEGNPRNWSFLQNTTREELECLQSSI